MPRVRIADVAARAGVSITTVSHALSGVKRVSPDAKRRVDAAVAQLGYRPDQVAQGLRHGATRTVAVLLPRTDGPHQGVLLQSLLRALDEGGHVAIVHTTDGRGDLEERSLLEVRDRGVVGVVIDAVVTPPARVRGLLGPGVAVVFLSDPGEEPGVDAVHLDDLDGIERAVTHLQLAGRTRIAFAEATETRISANRRLALADVVERRGLPALTLLRTSGGTGGPADLAGPLVAGRLDAVVCADAASTSEILSIVATSPISIPSALAVVSFEEAAPDRPARRLAVIESSASCSGALTGRLLLDRLADPRLEARRRRSGSRFLAGATA